MMRMILVDHARARHAAKRGGAAESITLQETILVSPARAPDVLELNEALEGLAKVDARKAKVIELRYFGGLTVEEIAEISGCSPTTVKREWTFAKAWLYRDLGG